MKKMNAKLDEIKRNIAVATGAQKASFAIRNVKIFHMTDGSMEEGDILIEGDKIVGVGACCRRIAAEKEFDGKSLYAVPGFIDTHVHIESSLLTPREYEKCVLPHGVTTAVCDPHELSNIAGTAAWDYFIACAEKMTMDLIIRLSSCVPATHLETAGAEISSRDILAYQGKKHVYGLGEMMNVPGVLFRDEEILTKIISSPVVDGHAPLLSGNALNGCITACVRNCHESSLLEEAEEKLRRGMNVLIREGSTAKNLDTLLPLINLKNSPFLAFCTDDRNPADIWKRGHIDKMIAHCIEKGADMLTVYRLATYSAANIASLPDRGLVAPGRRADIVLLSDLEKCQVEYTFAGGKKVEPSLFNAVSFPPVPENFLHSVKREKVTKEDLLIRKKDWRGDVIKLVPGSLITKKLSIPIPEKDGYLLGDKQQDIQKLFVLERHGKNGNIGKGFVHGFGMEEGAIATSIGHDSHNICVTGVSDEDILLAANVLIEKGGGIVVVKAGAVLAHLSLPLCGLMSLDPFEKVVENLEEIFEKVKLTSCKIDEPFMALAFLPLPVIPEIKLTDKGLVDVEKFCFY